MKQIDLIFLELSMDVEPFEGLVQGVLRRGVPIINIETEKKLQWKRMFRLHSNEAEEIKTASEFGLLHFEGTVGGES